jgi:glycosyltransferase involved in cell wall biosynthesis
MTQNKPKILISSPALTAVSGVSSHVRMLLGSSLAERYELIPFQVGREGRCENPLQRLARFLFSPLQLAGLLVWHRPHIVHLNTSMDLKGFWRDLVYLMVARLLGRRVVNQFHSGSGPQSLFSNPLLAFLLKRVLLASSVVAVLSSEAQSLYKQFDARIAVDWVPNAIDTCGLLDVGRAERSAGEPLKLVYVGRIFRPKGLFDVLEAVKLLKEQGLKLSLQIAGLGPDEAAVHASIARLGLEEEVKILGPVHGEAKNQLWLGSDVHVFPTYHDEGLPYSILESLAAGCVPITCSVAAIPDVMQNGVQGVFVPPHNPEALAAAIRHFAEHRDELGRMSLAGRRRIAEQYTVDRLASRFGEIYARVS